MRPETIPENNLIERFSNPNYSKGEWADDYKKRYGRVLEASDIMIRRMNAYATDTVLLSTPRQILKILDNVEQRTKRPSDWVGRIIFSTVNTLPTGVRDFLARASFQLLADHLSKIADIARGVQQYDKGPALTEGVNLDQLQKSAEELQQFVNSRYFTTKHNP